MQKGPHVVAPDIAGWRRVRMPYMPATAYIDAVPIEIADLWPIPSAPPVSKT